MRPTAAFVVVAALALGSSACTTAPTVPTGPVEPQTSPTSSGPSHAHTVARRHSGAQLPPYTSSVRRIGPSVHDRMRFSHHRGCPVQLADLRYLRVAYVGFDGRAHSGELVVHRRYADRVVEAFGRLYRARWPIQRMQLVDRYGGRDRRSMAANNTSAYNCRRVAGSDAWSAHAYGTAIDVNPLQNPYLTGSGIYPPAGAPFAKINRSETARHSPRGAIHDGDVVVRSFARIGWEWGGRWSAFPDFQHFSAKDG
jgi:poly-gamma-glutamate synthesis protein (capsule biosynthesis protein)